MPQAIFSPESPDGCVWKSSGIACTMTALPSISRIVNRVVTKAPQAVPSFTKIGGKSPACAGCSQFSGL